MCGDPMRVPASTCQLVRQTNIMMEYRQLDWAAGIRARPSAVCLTLLTPRAAALRPKACGESCTTMPREPDRVPALNVYGVQQSDAMMEYRQLDWAAGSCVLLRPRCHGRPRCPARDYALRSRARYARTCAPRPAPPCQLTRSSPFVSRVLRVLRVLRYRYLPPKSWVSMGVRRKAVTCVGGSPAISPPEM